MVGGAAVVVGAVVVAGGAACRGRSGGGGRRRRGRRGGRRGGRRRVGRRLLRRRGGGRRRLRRDAWQRERGRRRGTATRPAVREHDRQGAAGHEEQSGDRGDRDDRPFSAPGRYGTQNLGRGCGLGKHSRAGHHRGVVVLLPQGQQQRLAVLRPGCRVLGERRRDDACQGRGQVGSQIGDDRRWVVAMHAHELHRVPGDERERAGEHPVEDHAERVDVARGACRLAARLLRRDVGRRAEHGSGFRERARTAHSRDPEVGDLDALLGVEEHVRGFEVAVHEAAVVRVREAGRDLRRDPERLGIRLTLPVAEPVLQRAVREVLEHHVRAAVRLAVVVEGADVRMGERSHRPGLALEPCALGARREHLRLRPAARARRRRRARLRSSPRGRVVRAAGSGRRSTPLSSPRDYRDPR